MLGIERVEVLLKPVIGGYSRIDGAADRFGGAVLHVLASREDLSRKPKNRGPFQREPVIAQATLDRLL